MSRYRSGNEDAQQQLEITRQNGIPAVILGVHIHHLGPENDGLVNERCRAFVILFVLLILCRGQDLKQGAPVGYGFVRHTRQRYMLDVASPNPFDVHRNQ
jgi:hypothetical protein